jgi:hypothetical protein
MSRRLPVPQERLKGADMLRDLDAEHFAFSITGADLNLLQHKV